MTEQFDIYERLYRAVYPPEIMPMFWKENGEIYSVHNKEEHIDFVTRKNPQNKYWFTDIKGNAATAATEMKQRVIELLP